MGADYFWKILFDILTVYLWYGYLLAHIKYVQMVLTKVAEYLLVYHLTYHDSLFSYIQEILVFFSSLGNSEFLMFWLKHFVTAVAIMSEFHLRILTGVSPFGVAFLLFILLISLFTSSALKYLNENLLGSLKELFVRKLLGWFLYFFKLPLVLCLFLP